MKVVLLMLFVSLSASFAQSAGDQSTCRRSWLDLGRWNEPWCTEKPAPASEEAKKADEELKKNAKQIAAANAKRDRDQEKYSDEVKRVDRELDTLVKEMRDTVATIEREEKYLVDRETDLLPDRTKISVGKNGVEKPENLLASVSRLEAAKDRLAALRKKAQEHGDTVDNVIKKQGESTEEYNKRMDQLTADGALLSSARETLLLKDRMKAQQKEIAGMRVTDRITKLQIAGLTAEQKIEALERELDQDLMGGYLREKMAKLLASKAFCDAKNSCEKSEDRLDDPKYIDEKYKSLEKVFSADTRQILRDSTKSSAPPKRSGSAN